MRLSPTELLIVLVFIVPVVVQLRTVLGFFDIYVSPFQAIGVGVMIVAVIVLWAVFPDIAPSPKEKSNGG